MTQTIEDVERQIDELIDHGHDAQTELDELRDRLSDLALAVVEGVDGAQAQFDECRRQIAETESNMNVLDLATVAASRKLGQMRLAQMDEARRAALAERDRLARERVQLWKQIGASTVALVGQIAQSLQLDRAIYQAAVDGEDRAATAWLTGGRRSLESFILWQLSDVGFDVSRPTGEMRRQLASLFDFDNQQEMNREQRSDEDLSAAESESEGDVSSPRGSGGGGGIDFE